MKIQIPKDKLRFAPEHYLRKAGYHYRVNRKTGQASFTRSLGSGSYPQFHIYLKEEQGSIILNLHLDQKKPSYDGAHAHNAEYDGGVIEEEFQRLQALIRD
jgi:hypothetical protein